MVWRKAFILCLGIDRSWHIVFGLSICPSVHLSSFFFVCKNFCIGHSFLKCNSSPDKHVFLYLFPDCLCIIIHFSVSLTTIRARVLCLFAQVCKRKNPISEPRLDLAVILVTSRYEHNTLPVNSEQ